MRIKGFYHIYAINNWHSIVTNHLRILLTSGLYNACEEINVSLICFQEDEAVFRKFFSDVYPKFIVRNVSANPMDYEFNALRMIERDNSDYIGFYFHTKGVTRPFEPNISQWNAWISEAILNRWREHAERVSTGGYDVSSVNFLKSPDHFSGNFWWFNRRYITRLPKVDNLDLNNRFHAEQYICMRKRRNQYAGEFIEPGRDVFKIQYNENT